MECPECHGNCTGSPKYIVPGFGIPMYSYPEETSRVLFFKFANLEKIFFTYTRILWSHILPLGGGFRAGEPAPCPRGHLR